MSVLWWLPVIAIACGAQVTVQIGWVRLYPQGGLYRALLAGFVGGFVVLAAVTALCADRPWGQHLANLGIYVCFTYTYFHWNNMGETARRIRLVIELSGAPQGLTRAEILARYNAREIIDRRMARLFGSGQLVSKDERLHLANPSVFLMSAAIALLKRLLMVERPPKV